MAVDWTKLQRNMGGHKHLSTEVLDPDTGLPLSSPTNDFVTQETLDEALAALDFPPDVVNNFVTEIATHDTFVTEIVQNETFITQLTEEQTFIEQTVNQITEVQENNTYITQVTQNSTFVTNVTNLVNANTNAKKGVAGELASLGSDGYLTDAQMAPNLLAAAAAFLIDGGGAVITAGIKGDLLIPFTGVITGWKLLADVSGSIVVDLWKDTYANYPPTIADTITASAKPTLSSAAKNQATSVGTWTTAVTAGDIIRINVEATPSTVTKVTLVLLITRSQ
jgi:hypothetical protein